MEVSVVGMVQWLLVGFTFAPMLFFLVAIHDRMAFFTSSKPAKCTLKSHSTLRPTVQKRQSSSQELDLQSMFPPSRRSFSTELQSIATRSPEVRIHPNASSKRQDGQSLSCTTTPTGFTSEDIRMIGEFPNYAELSGVPLPKPSLEFKIETALPRPYRPFRWVYHQTMCKCPSLPSLEIC